MKAREKIKIGIFQPNVKNYPSIESQLSRRKRLPYFEDLTKFEA